VYNLFANDRAGENLAGMREFAFWNSRDPFRGKISGKIFERIGICAIDMYQISV
jgi:hypothetical protein